jgi:FKBP-type peptidyl-prolyl cis-trans isomerase
MRPRDSVVPIARWLLVVGGVASLVVPLPSCGPQPEPRPPDPPPAESTPKASAPTTSTSTATPAATGTAASGVEQPALRNTSSQGSPPPSGSALTQPAANSASTIPRAELARQSRLVPYAKEGASVRVAGAKTSSSGVVSAVLQPGTGEPPPLGANVDVHITCWLRSGENVGREFWNSRDDRAGQPHSYRIDPTDIVQGLVELISEMKRGERRWAIIPSRLAYGETGYGDLVPAGSDIVVDVELVRVRERR